VVAGNRKILEVLRNIIPDQGRPGNYTGGMTLLGHGIDLVETERIARMVREHGQRFLDRCFTAAEQAYCAANSKRRIEHLSGRFAAKEAVLKAIGTGWRGGIAWTDIEVLRHESGQPYVLLSGECLRIAEKMGVKTWVLSISHVSSHAAASAIALGAENSEF
jgi:holo-[acyl-carrier protein] synthase